MNAGRVRQPVGALATWARRHRCTGTNTPADGPLSTIGWTPSERRFGVVGRDPFRWMRGEERWCA